VFRVKAHRDEHDEEPETETDAIHRGKAQEQAHRGEHC